MSMFVKMTDHTYEFTCKTFYKPIENVSVLINLSQISFKID